MPDVIPILSASRWIGFKTSGRTSPAVIACDLPGGGEVECVVKLGGHKESTPHQPVCETVAALLALDLGLPIAEPMLVEITKEFAREAIPATQPDARARCEKALGFAFATKHLPPGNALLPAGKSPSKKLLPALAELYAFDGLIQNADRMAINPNCLVRGDALHIFDHDQAFGFLLDINGLQPVEKPESYPFLKKHLAYPFLNRDRTQFNRLEGAWEAISAATVTGYKKFLPDDWPGKKIHFPAIEAYLHQLHPKLASAFDAITLTLSAKS